MYKVDDHTLNWDTVPQTRGEIQGIILRTSQAIQRLLETKIAVSEQFADRPDAEELIKQINTQLEIYKQDEEALARIEAVTDLLRDVSLMPRCELPPIPKTKKARKARKPKTQEPTDENLS